MAGTPGMGAGRRPGALHSLALAVFALTTVQTSEPPGGDWRAAQTGDGREAVALAMDAKRAAVSARSTHEHGHLPPALALAIRSRSLAGGDAASGIAEVTAAAAAQSACSEEDLRAMHTCIGLVFHENPPVPASAADAAVENKRCFGYDRVSQCLPVCFCQLPPPGESIAELEREYRSIKQTRRVRMPNECALACCKGGDMQRFREQYWDVPSAHGPFQSFWKPETPMDPQGSPQCGTPSIWPPRAPSAREAAATRKTTGIVTALLGLGAMMLPLFFCLFYFGCLGGRAGMKASIKFRGRGLAAMDILTRSSDPYLVFTQNGKELGRTEVVDQDLDPAWQPLQLVFTNVTSPVQVACWDKDTITRDDLIGEASVSVQELITSHHEIELLAKGKLSGTIVVDHVGLDVELSSKPDEAPTPPPKPWYKPW